MKIWGASRVKVKDLRVKFEVLTSVCKWKIEPGPYL